MLVDSSVHPKLPPPRVPPKGRYRPRRSEGFGGKKHRLSVEQNDELAKGIDDHIKSHGLDTTSSKVIVQTTVRQRTRSLKAFTSYWDAIRRFAGRLGDFQTATIFDRKRCPADPLPAKPETIALYFRWKTGQKDEVLKDSKGNPVYQTGLLNSTEKSTVPIKCVFDWHCPSNIDKNLAAINALHNAYKHLKGNYRDVCTDCRKANSLKEGQYCFGPGSEAPAQWRSCMDHANAPLLKPRGNTATSALVLETSRFLRNKLSADHTIKGNAPMLPAQIRKIKEKLCASGSVRDHQLWVMINLGITLFLRASEIITLKCEDFLMDHSIVHPNAIKALVVKIKGKTEHGDADSANLQIRRDDLYPEFCVVRSLFSWVKSQGIKSGYLFRSDADPDDPNQHMSYSCFLNRLKAMLGSVFPDIFGKEGKTAFQVGTHTLRKTAYLFAIWGILTRLEDAGGVVDGSMSISDFNMDSILKAARHTGVDNARKYIKDSPTLYMTAKKERCAEKQRVSPWFGMYLENFTGHYCITGPSRLFRKDTLYDQADDFFLKEVTITNLGSFADYYERALACLPPETSESKLKMIMSTAYWKEAPQSFKDMLMDFNRLLNRETVVQAEAEVRNEAKRTASDSAICDVTPKKRPRTIKRGDDACDDWKLESKGLASPREVYEFCLKIESAMTGDEPQRPQSCMTDSARKWARNRRNAAVAMRACVEKCWEGSEKNFLESKTKLNVIRYKCTCSK